MSAPGQPVPDVRRPVGSKQAHTFRTPIVISLLCLSVLLASPTARSSASSGASTLPQVGASLPAPEVLESKITVGSGDYIAGGDGYGYCRGEQPGHNYETHLATAAAGAIVASLGLTGVAGAFAAEQLRQLLRNATSSAGGTGKEWLEKLGLVDSYASCSATVVVVPVGTNIAEITGWAADGQSRGYRPCRPDPQHRYVCQIGWSEWVWTQRDRVVVGIFKNWSADRTRQAMLRVKYTD